MNTNAIILKEIMVKDEDKIVVAFSKEYGKISMYAKEGKKIKSPFLAGTQFLTYSNFYIHKKDNISDIKRIEIKEAFSNIKNDISKLYLAMYLAEFVENLIIEDNPSREMFNFFLYSLVVLKDSEKVNIRLFKNVFELRMLSLAGYTPNVVTCQECDTELNEEGYFVPRVEGLLCNSCNPKKEGTHLSATTIYTLKYILYSKEEKIYKFDIDTAYLTQLDQALTNFKKTIIDKELKTEKFIIYD